MSKENTAQFESDLKGAKIGMWLFLFTEILLFGGLFLMYSVYRVEYPGDFHYGATNLNVGMGTLNTIILLTSSLTMVLSVAYIKRLERKKGIIFLNLTILLGLVFLIIKYLEWSAKIEHGLYPGSSKLVTHTPGENLFYGLYYSMTGLHAIHVLVGIGVLAVMVYLTRRKPRRQVKIEPGDASRIDVRTEDGENLWSGDCEDDLSSISMGLIYENDNERWNRKDSIRLEISGLYWHLVDIIWIFLFPLFYLIT